MGITRFPALGIHHTMLGLPDTFIGNRRIQSNATWEIQFPALGICHTMLGLADTFIGNGRIQSDATWDYTMLGPVVASIGNPSHSVGIG